MNNHNVPALGYILTNWDNQIGYRSTAHAYLKREGLTSVKNTNGSWYSISDIENAMIAT